MIKFILKGILRDKSRSMFPVMTVAAGAFLAVFFYAFMSGVFSDMFKTITLYDTGHVRVVTRAYHELIDQLPNDLAMLEADDMLAKLRAEKPEMLWTPRIRFGGLLDIPDENGETLSQGPVIGMGVDLRSPGSPEHQILEIKDKIIEGRMPEKKNELLITKGFAEKINAKVGDDATLISSTMYGSMAMHTFNISGIIEFGVVALDRNAIVADIEDVRLALDMENAASEIVGYTQDLLFDDEESLKIQQEFNKKYFNEKDEFSPKMISLRDGSGFGYYLDIMDYYFAIIIGVFMFAMSIVLWNSGLLNSLRRYGEIGVRLAMGEPKGVLYRRMILESIIIGIIGSAIGTVLGLAISYYLQIVGIDFGSMMQKSEIMIMNVYRCKVTLSSYYIGFMPGVLASALGTIFAGIGIYRRQTANLFKELEV
jgi:putative ABC transport system permease protein